VFGRILLAICFMSAVTVALQAQNTRVDPAATRIYAAHATAVVGQVSLVTSKESWAITTGQRIPIQQVIATGSGAYAHFEISGGSSFDVFSDSRVVFRANAADPRDLLDVLGGRVRVHLEAGMSQMRQRVFCPTAIVTAEEPSTIAVAVDEDDTARIDVTEGEVRVQHALLPNDGPTLVRAIDAILVRPDQPISRRLDRGGIYRFTVKSLHTVFTAITFGHAGPTNLASPFSAILAI
jgi:ferric-dicitrate binding protein FerR (iron transport regulator)